MENDGTEIAFAAWTMMVRATARIQDAIEAGLKEAGLPALGWYDALWELEQAGPDGLRPFELEGRLLLPQYGLSRLIARLEAAGLVIRRPSPGDGRGQIVAISDEGRETRRRMWPVYRRAIEASVGARLTEAEADQLAYLLRRITGGPGRP